MAFNEQDKLKKRVLEPRRFSAPETNLVIQAPSFVMIKGFGTIYNNILEPFINAYPNILPKV